MFRKIVIPSTSDSDFRPPFCSVSVPADRVSGGTGERGSTRQLPCNMIDNVGCFDKVTTVVVIHQTHSETRKSRENGSSKGGSSHY